MEKQKIIKEPICLSIAQEVDLLFKEAQHKRCFGRAKRYQELDWDSVKLADDQ